MKVYNALDLKKGAKADYNKMGTITQPVQFLPAADKGPEWAAWNMDWLEWQGQKQLRRNAQRLMKNYKLAAGIIDKADYIPSVENDYTDIVEQLTAEDPSALELKFYPIIPNVVNTLVTEFSKRNKIVQFRGVDSYTHNEILNKKREQVENVLVKQAEMNMMQKMIDAGADPNDPQFQQQMQQETSPEKLKTLPEIEKFFTKDYRTLAEQWASHQHTVDEARFSMDELEERGFRDSLITDREFWHFKMYEDDYDIELWNPALTFYHKSPNERYISNSNFVGKTEMMTTADIIDQFGWLMTESQLESIEAIYPVRSAGYPITGMQNDGSYYDATKSHEWNTANPPSLAYRQFLSMSDNFEHQGGDIVNRILGESEDYNDLGTAHLLRVTTAYWKSQMRVGHLTEKTEDGDTITAIITEDYKVTNTPIYNNQLINNKDKRTLVFGQHIDWIWINQTWGTHKIGPNHPSFWGMTSPGGINPIYLGINQNQPGPLKFQFKGDKTLYGCKLPVEGRVFSDRNTRSNALVDLMKPFQIGFNIVNNQIADILVDELGTIIMIDQNALPRHSLGEDWGKGNYAKAYVAMKDFQILPLDPSIANTENATQFGHFQTLNMEQTSRLMSRIQLGNYFKQEAFQVVGVNPQRMGQQIGQYETATGVEQAVSGSYAQTEVYFKQHSDELMPRVHQMRTDLAQFYQSTNPSVRLQTMTSTDERVNFQMNGTDLLLRDINVYCVTKANHRHILEKMRAMAEQSTAQGGASIYDLGPIVQAESVGTLNNVLKDIEAKQIAQRQETMQHEQQMKEKEMEQRSKELQMANDHDRSLQENKSRTDILVAEIRASGFGAMQDLNENKQSDFVDAMTELKKTEQFQEQINMQQTKESNRQAENVSKQNMKREEMDLQRELKDKDLQIARENKNQYDQKKPNKKDKK